MTMPHNHCNKNDVVKLAFLLLLYHYIAQSTNDRSSFSITMASSVSSAADNVEINNGYDDAVSTYSVRADDVSRFHGINVHDNDDTVNSIKDQVLAAFEAANKKKEYYGDDEDDEFDDYDKDDDDDDECDDCGYEHQPGSQIEKNSISDSYTNSYTDSANSNSPQSENNSNNNNDQIMPFIVPRYFRTLHRKRQNAELQFYSKHHFWRQKVILEILYHQMFGRHMYDDSKQLTAIAKSQNQNVHQLIMNNIIDPNDLGLHSAIGTGNRYNDAVSSIIGVMRHPVDGNHIPFLKEFYLDGWDIDTTKHECEWEGISCGFYHFHHKEQIKKDDNGQKKKKKKKNDDSKDDGYVFQSKFMHCFCTDKDYKTMHQEESYFHDVYNDDDEYGDSNNDVKLDINDTDDCQCNNQEDIVHTKHPEGAVTHIILENNDLIGGSLPSDLVHLPYLKTLVIKGSHFIGPIPTEFGKMKNINEIHFEGLQILGGIPTEIGLLNFTLEALTLRDCQIQGSIPDEIMSLTNLQRLDLSRNLITGTIPSGLSKLTKLSYLDLGENTLSDTFPSKIGDLKDLTHLHLDHNTLSGTIPMELFDLQSIKSLDLESNKLRGPIFYFLSNLRNIKTLKLGMNQFTGRLPEETWDYLETIDLKFNSFTGTIPLEFFGPMFQSVDLSDNKFEGTVPQLRRNYLKKMNKLHLSNNMLTGSVNLLKRLPNGASVGIAGNMLTGEIKEGHCPSLEGNGNYSVPFRCTDLIACSPGTFHPDGFANHLSGCIKCPSCETKSTQECDYLGQNQCVNHTVDVIRGDIDGDGTLSPREILRLFYVLNQGAYWGENYAKWSDMTVHECKLSGINCKGSRITKIDLRGATLCASKPNCGMIIPEFFLLGESLEVLDLSGSFASYIKLAVPPLIGKLSYLKILDLSNNVLSSIPDEISNMTSLQILNLAHCRYEGEIPNLWKLERLEKLTLSANSFSNQKFPAEVGMLTNIRELLVSQSKLKGAIPSELGNLSKLKTLELNGNELTGKIPSTFENFTQLRSLDLKHNNLEGSIDFITKIPEIEVIDLSNNKFRGTVPNDIGKLQKLTVFDISNNTLSGNIPFSLADTALKELNIGNNKFQAPLPASLCANTVINGGPRGHAMCDHIACPIGKISDIGRSKGDTKCEPCSKGQTTLSLGMSLCRSISKYEYFTMIEALFKQKNWEFDEDTVGIEKNECDLNIVNCDDDGQVMSLVVPLNGIKYNDALFRQ